jgi:hypothetical protein
MTLFLRRTVPLLALLAVVLLPTGCGEQTGRVKGKITVGGVPLKRGLITFVSDAGNKDAFAAAIIDGVYESDPIPVGRAKITISNSLDEEVDRSTANDLVPVRKRGQKGTQVPAEYGDPDRSGLTIEIGPGMNTFDKDL